MPNLGHGYKIKTGKDGKARVVKVVDQRLDASAKIRQRTSKRQKVVRRTV